MKIFLVYIKDWPEDTYRVISVYTHKKDAEEQARQLQARVKEVELNPPHRLPVGYILWEVHAEKEGDITYLRPIDIEHCKDLPEVGVQYPKYGIGNEDYVGYAIYTKLCKTAEDAKRECLIDRETAISRGEFPYDGQPQK